MKRVGLFLGFPPEGGGAFQYAQCTLNALAALSPLEYEILVVHAHPAWTSILATFSGRIHTFETHVSKLDRMARLALRFGFPLALWHAMAPIVGSMERSMLNHHCDLWWFPDQSYLSYALPAPTVGVIHDLMHRHERHFPEVNAWGLYRRRERHYRHMCRHAKAILVDSTLGKQHVLDAYPIDETRVQVVPFAPPAYIHSRDVPADFDARYDLPEQYVFYPAQQWRHKNHVRLIEAIAKVRRKHPDLHLVLAGSGKNAAKDIATTIEMLGLRDAVRILGYVPDADMAELYRRSSGLVMPTFFGPTNIPPLEAMAVGCPMAISDVYAMKEQSRDAAIYFDPRSTDDIADAVDRLIGDEKLRQRLTAAGTRRAAELSQAAFNSRIHDVIHRVLPPT